ncbi:MAG: O-antigen ligase family protein [Erysipelothrix sp.]|nr:O-antigen ligase family protein [Erysipelothrix sp.]
MSHVKNKWPMHVFFISQGVSLFGIGYAVLPVLILLFWLVKTAIKTPGMFKDLFTDDRCYWVWIYYLLFIVTVIISDLTVGGKLTHLEGPLYNLALGVYMLLGYLVVKSYDSDEVQIFTNSWFVLWLFALLAIVEIYYRGIYRYHHGIFAAPHILFSGVIMVGLVNLAHLVERYNFNRFLSSISVILVLWSLISSYKYSVSDVLPHLYVICAFIIMLLSTKKLPMCFFSFLIFGSVICVLCKLDVLDQIKSIDLTSTDLWMGLLSGREYVWSATVRMIGQYPFLGVGSGNFSAVCKKILTEMNVASPYNTFAHAHSLLLQNFVVHGMFAGTAFIALLLSVFRLIFNNFGIERNMASRLAALGLWLIYVLYGSVDNAPLYEEMIPLFWGSIGLFMGMVAKEVKTDE